MKKHKVKTSLIIILIFIIIVIMLVLILEKTEKIEFINKIKHIIMKQQINQQISDDIKIIDVTNIKDTINIEHEHVIKTMYNQTKHWEECIICNKKQNEKVHTLVTTWALRKRIMSLY